MNFDNVINLKNYYSFDEAKNFRKQLWDKNSKIVKQLKEELFDNDINEDIYVINDFLDKSIYLLDKIDILLEITKTQFEVLVENNIIPKYKTDNIDYYIHIIDEDKYYYYNNDFFKQKEVILERREMLC